VLIVEDHPLYRDGVLALLQREAPQLRCRAVGSAEEALPLLRGDSAIDLLLSDLMLPGPMDGLALLARALVDAPTAARVLMSGSEEAVLPQHCRHLGLMGFLPKGLAPALWLLALGQILDGEPWFPPSANDAAARPNVRHVEILEFLARGQANKEIGMALGITERTVKYHLREIYGRLDAANRAEAVARAAALGWIRLPA
jgi:DNA-binding NarL/FixJ family response regulator